MRRKQRQIEVLEQLAGLEDATSDLYKAYGDRLADLERFWLDLAADETTHASWIRQLEPLVSSGTVDFSEGRFRTKVIQNFMDYVNEERARARGQRMPLIKAISIALDIEKAFLEKKLFDVVEGDSLELERVLNQLAAATQEHRDMLQKLWDKHRELQR